MFLKYARSRLKPLGVRLSVDVFGLSATRDLGIAQFPKPDRAVRGHDLPDGLPVALRVGRVQHHRSGLAPGHDRRVLACATSAPSCTAARRCSCPGCRTSRSAAGTPSRTSRTRSRRPASSTSRASCCGTRQAFTRSKRFPPSRSNSAAWRFDRVDRRFAGNVRGQSPRTPRATGERLSTVRRGEASRRRPHQFASR